MPSTGFEPAIPACERPQTYALDRAATGISFVMTLYLNVIIYLIKVLCIFCGMGTKYKRIIQMNIANSNTQTHYLLNWVPWKCGLTPHMEVVLYNLTLQALQSRSFRKEICFRWDGFVAYIKMECDNTEAFSQINLNFPPSSHKDL